MKTLESDLLSALHGLKSGDIPVDRAVATASVARELLSERKLKVKILALSGLKPTTAMVNYAQGE
jgi:hypothetical protein